MKTSVIYRLYFLGGGGFLFALSKYLFLGDAVLMPKYFLFEFISFALFLDIMYLADRFIKKSHKNTDTVQLQNMEERKEREEEIERLQNIIADLRRKEQSIVIDVTDMDQRSNKIAESLQNCEDINQFASKLLNKIGSVYEVGLGICYFYDKPSGRFTVKATYGLCDDVNPEGFVAGEGLNGQSVIDLKSRIITDVPQDYLNIESGSGLSKPNNLYLLPIVTDNNCIGLLELASFSDIRIHEHWNYFNNSIVNVIDLNLL